MQVNLTNKEVKIINNYRYHLWKTAGVREGMRKTLARIIFEIKDELKIIKKELHN